VNLKLQRLCDKPAIAQLAVAIENIPMEEIDTLTEEDAAKLLFKEKNEDI
jgi:hypothetical protein